MIYSIFYFEPKEQKIPIGSAELGWVKAENEIDALKKWYSHINAYYFHTSKWTSEFCYEAKLDSKNNIRL